jgi:hypothetical protein
MKRRSPTVLEIRANMNAILLIGSIRWFDPISLLLLPIVWGQYFPVADADYKGGKTCPAHIRFTLHCACGPQHLSRNIKYRAADILIDVVKLRQPSLDVGLETVALAQVKLNRATPRQVIRIPIPGNESPLTGSQVHSLDQTGALCRLP